MNQFESKSQQILIKRYLPHNFLAEKMILSCLLINPKAIEITLRTLSSDAFYFKNHQEIYKAIMSMYKSELTVDTLTIITFLQDNGLLEKVGGVKVILELMIQFPNLTYLEEYIRLIKDKFIRRSLIKLGYEIINSGYITNISLENILNEFENKLFNLVNEVEIKQLSTSAEITHNIFFELKKKSLNPTLPGLSSGFYDLDSFTQGFQKSDLIIIAGRPSIGKTALGLNITLNIIKDLKLPVLFISLEMSKEQVMYRLLSMETALSQMKLKGGKLSLDDWKRLTQVIKVISKLPLFIDDTFHLSVEDIRLKLKKILFEYDQIGLVIIDYLQLMQNSNLKNDNRVQELSQITRSLKIIAREFNIPIIALSQLSRNIENRLDKKPVLSDLRESGSIEQDADLVLMLYRNFSSNNLDLDDFQLIELIIAKQRNGPIGSIKLKFNKKQTKFSNLEIESVD